jgi:hypothetical protein
MKSPMTPIRPTKHVGPVRHPVAGSASRAAPRAFILAMHRQKLAASRVQRHYIPSRTRGDVQPAVGENWCGLKSRIRPVTERIGLKAPGRFEFVEVSCVDLRERRVTRARQIACIVMPLSVWCDRPGRRRGHGGRAATPRALCPGARICENQ